MKFKVPILVILIIIIFLRRVEISLDNNLLAFICSFILYTLRLSFQRERERKLGSRQTKTASMKIMDEPL